jgi:hypothetical protein
MMNTIFRSAYHSTALAFLLSLLVVTGTARAGAITPCDFPFIFESVAANIVPIEYLATSADKGADDRLSALQETAQRLAWLIKLDSWHQSTYGSLGVVPHMFLGRKCDPDEVLERLLLYGGAGPPVRPGQILVLVQGKIFIEVEKIFLQTRLRGFRRNLEEGEGRGPLARYVTREGIDAALRGDVYRMEAGLPDLDITFAPRAMTMAEFGEIDRVFAQASRLHSEPSEGSSSEEFTFIPGETQAFQVEIINGGEWLRVEDMMARVSAKLANTSSFRHSSRNLPLKLSTKAFCTGFPGAM